MKTRRPIGQFLRTGIPALCAAMWLSPCGWAQAAKSPAPGAPTILTVDQPDAQRTKEELAALLEHYPPALRGVLALDPALLDNESYLAPYPALVSFLGKHPEVQHNPSFYLGDGGALRFNRDSGQQVLDIWREVMQALFVFGGFGLAIGLIVWLIRTLVDYNRWSRLARVQTDAHTKLLDRFTANEDMLAYIQSPAGAKFLQSSPITLDAAPRNVGAPMGRILWSVQGGVVLIAGGIGLYLVSGRVPDTVAPSLNGLGILGVALGVGFVISAIISYVISQRLGLIETVPPAARQEVPGA